MSNLLHPHGLQGYERRHPLSQSRLSFAMIGIMAYLAAVVMAGVLLQIRLPEGAPSTAVGQND